ncbi:MutS domain V protein [Ancylostoma ceylanicum]|uniref:MutS domain V protein n=1 Tax=Ancylostoma ceylanicum TaxID=53326 RepID=A0A0D6LP40_9BILA|nr:MutS domain V protein [Ancylostoma ceylanicum]
MDLRQADIEINEFIDSSTFSRLKMKLMIAEPVEIILAESFNDKSGNALMLEMIRSVLPNVTVTNIHRRFFNEVRGAELVMQLANEEISNCDGVVLQKQYAMQACCALVRYVEHIQNILFASKTLRFIYRDIEKMCMLDVGSWQNLEIISNAPKKEHRSLLSVIDETLTSGGGRLLRSNLLQPSADQEIINQRLDAVEELLENPQLIEKLRLLLSSTYDLDHVFDIFIGSPTVDTVQTADFHLTQLLRLKNVLNVVDPLRQLVKSFKCELMTRKGELLSDERIDVIKKLLDDRFRSESIGNNKKNSLNQRHKKCYAIKENVSVNLDVARRAYEELVRDIQSQDRIEQSISEVMIATNVVVQEVIKEIRPSIAVLYHVMECLATTDFLCSLAAYAFNRDTVRPKFGDSIIISEGRHPLLDYSMGDTVVPNDTTGKSTYLKQVCQLCILAQCGSLLPAKVAVLPVFLRIFSRVGHNDNLQKNLSAFALEMDEIALILQYADDRTLLVIDELARSTSTEEGIGISYAIIEKLIQHRTFTIFATHFLDLAALDVNYLEVENFHFPPQVTYVDGQEQLSPTHKLQKGPYNGPLYGFELVELSTFPREVIDTARELGHRLHEETADKRTMNADALLHRTLLRAAHRLRQVVASKDLVSKESLIKSLKAIRTQLRADIADVRDAANED